MVNNVLSSLMEQESYRDHKRTQQRVPNEFLYYICYNYAFNIIVLVPFTMFQTYNIICFIIIQETKEKKLN